MITQTFSVGKFTSIVLSLCPQNVFKKSALLQSEDICLVLRFTMRADVGKDWSPGQHCVHACMHKRYSPNQYALVLKITLHF